LVLIELPYTLAGLGATAALGVGTIMNFGIVPGSRTRGRRGSLKRAASTQVRRVLMYIRWLPQVKSNMSVVHSHFTKRLISGYGLVF